MIKLNPAIIATFFMVAVTCVFSQIKHEVVLTGTVYISSSAAPGMINGKPLTESKHPFKNQFIYFKKDTLTVKGFTDSLGRFSVLLKEGTYEVYQAEGLQPKKSQLTSYGSASVEVNKNNTPCTIEFKNTSNRRTTITHDPNAKSSNGSATNINKKPTQK